MNNNPLASLFFGLLFAVVGYFVAFHFGKPILDNARASTTWPSVEGIIEQSSVSTTHRSGKNKKTMYAAEITYRYTVEAQEYHCSTVAFGGNGSSSSSQAAYALTKRYPVGQAVPVYYEPQKPENAVLEPGVTWASYAVYGIGLVFLVVGGLMSTVSAGYLAIGAMVVAGAVTGTIGKRRAAHDGDQPSWTSEPSSSRRDDSRSPPNDADDGFEIN